LAGALLKALNEMSAEGALIIELMIEIIKKNE